MSSNSALQYAIKELKRNDDLPTTFGKIQDVGNPKWERLLRQLVNELTDNDKILMPKTLTAENGDKELLMGEFLIYREMWDNESDEFYTMEIPIDWTTIKQIYKMAVDNLGVEL